MFSDSNWAGCRRTARSTNGAVMMRGTHYLKSWSSTLKNVTLSKGHEKEVDDDQPRSESPQTAEYSEVNAVGGFSGKNTGKPDPWDGDTEQVFKNWSERFTTYMVNAGDKV